MVKEAIDNVLSLTNNAGAVAAMLVGVGIWLGILQNQVLDLRDHPDEPAHTEQLKKQVANELLLKQISTHLASLDSRIGTMKVDLVAEITRASGDRWHRADMRELCYAAERMNEGWKCPFSVKQ